MKQKGESASLFWRLYDEINFWRLEFQSIIFIDYQIKF